MGMSCPKLQQNLARNDLHRLEYIMYSGLRIVNSKWLRGPLNDMRIDGSERSGLNSIFDSCRGATPHLKRCFMCSESRLNISTHKAYA